MHVLSGLCMAAVLPPECIKGLEPKLYAPSCLFVAVFVVCLWQYIKMRIPASCMSRMTHLTIDHVHDYTGLTTQYIYEGVFALDFN